VFIENGNKDNFPKKEKPAKLKLVHRDGFHLIPINAIIHCKSEGNYTRFFLNDTSNCFTSKTLKTYQQQLEVFGFMRVHKSNIVNLNHVVKFTSKGKAGELLMSNGQSVEVSKQQKTSLIEKLEAYHL